MLCTLSQYDKSTYLVEAIMSHSRLPIQYIEGFHPADSALRESECANLASVAAFNTNQHTTCAPGSEMTQMNWSVVTSVRPLTDILVTSVRNKLSRWTVGALTSAHPYVT